MNVKKHLPNFITLLNLVCGVFAILFFIQSTNSAQQSVNSLINPTYSAIEIGITLIGIATLLDFLDGFAARLLRVQSEIGAQLDSLADMVTFGVAPGFLVYASYLEFFSEQSILPYFFILLPAFSALRLAKFNVDEEQTTYFKGLATPANALFWIGMFYILKMNHSHSMSFVLLFLIVTMSLLMIADLRMFSLKLKNLKLEGDNVYRIILLIGAFILTILFGLFTNILAVIPFIILLYILLSLHYHYKKRKEKPPKHEF